MYKVCAVFYRWSEGLVNSPGDEICKLTSHFLIVCTVDLCAILTALERADASKGYVCSKSLPPNTFKKALRPH